MDVEFAILFTFVCSTNPLVSAFTKCEKVDSCKYETDEGELSLSSLARTAAAAPRFSDIKDYKEENLSYYWNPCIPWTPKDVVGSCSNIAAYAKVEQKQKSICISLGTQDSSKFSLDSLGNCVLSYNGSFIASTRFSVTLKCDGNTEATVEPVTSDPNERKFSTTLYSKYNCIQQSGLSTGTILIIIFICVVIVYLVAGILFNKFSKGATGKELLPNLSFWEDFPFLVKDGIGFTLKSARKLCCKQDSYESI